MIIIDSYTVVLSCICYIHLSICMAFQEEVERSSQVAFVSQSERKNARFQRYMEDTHKIIPCLDGDTTVFYASVFDGHGGKF